MLIKVIRLNRWINHNTINIFFNNVFSFDPVIFIAVVTFTTPAYFAVAAAAVFAVFRGGPRDMVGGARSQNIVIT